MIATCRARKRRRVGRIDAKDRPSADENRLAIADAGACCLEIGVADGCRLAGAVLDRDLGTESDEFLHRFGNRGAAGLARRRFPEDRDLHVA